MIEFFFVLLNIMNEMKKKSEQKPSIIRKKEGKKEWQHHQYHIGAKKNQFHSKSQTMPTIVKKKQITHFDVIFH